MNPNQEAITHLVTAITILNERLDRALGTRVQLLQTLANLTCPLTPGDVIQVQDYQTKSNKFVVIAIGPGHPDLSSTYTVITKTLKIDNTLGQTRTFDPTRRTLTVIDHYGRPLDA